MIKNKTVNICGIEHEIKEYDDFFDTDTHMGQIDYRDCLIKINKGLPDQLKNATICHEVLHGMLVHIGRNDLTTDEQFVTSLANAINLAFDVRYKKEN